MMTKPKLIFRVEDETGRGPYNGTISTRGFRDEKRNPPPGFDPLINEPGVLADYLPPPMFMPPTVVFGFSHAEQAQSWFYDPKIMKREKWEAHGAHIEVYKLDGKPGTLAEAKAQTVFVAPHAKPLGELPLSDLWTERPEEIEAEANTLAKEKPHHV
ncbi:MAG TPA: hypothetical protein VKQ30_16210 [Ktedonobacterales bacterium]|nr:hypothetical protein [Ktedonobacterales bacterium]